MSAEEPSTFTTVKCPNVPITNIAVVVSAGPSARATATSVTRSRQSERGSSASAHGIPTPRNIHISAGIKTIEGSNQSGIAVGFMAGKILPRSQQDAQRRKAGVVKAMFCQYVETKKAPSWRLVRAGNDKRQGVVGGDLLSQAVSSQVPSARAGLTAGFGMGPGVPPLLVSPTTPCRVRQGDEVVNYRLNRASPEEQVLSTWTGG